MKTIDKTKKMKLVEEKTGRDIRELLNELYEDKRLTFHEMEEYFKNEIGVDVNYSTIYFWFLKLGTKRRGFKL